MRSGPKDTSAEPIDDRDNKQPADCTTEELWAVSESIITSVASGKAAKNDGIRPHAGRVTHQSLSLSSASAASLDENFQWRNPDAKLHGQLLPPPASPLQRFAVLN